MKITETSKTLFIALANDAGNWSGSPLFGGNVGGSKESRGNLTQLKRAGLLRTEQDQDNRACSWVYFTQKGIEYAKEHGVDLSYVHPVT